MRGGRRLAEGNVPLDAARERARAEIATLPTQVRAIAAADPPYPVALSPALRDYQMRIRREALAT